MRKGQAAILVDLTLNMYSRGRTQIAAGSTTVLGIGPGLLIILFAHILLIARGITAPARLINQVTGKLRLL
jgi:hypothetical protein